MNSLLWLVSALATVYFAAADEWVTAVLCGLIGVLLALHIEKPTIR